VNSNGARLFVDHDVFELEAGDTGAVEFVALEGDVEILEENVADVGLAGIGPDGAEGVAGSLSHCEARWRSRKGIDHFALLQRDCRTARLSGGRTTVLTETSSYTPKVKTRRSTAANLSLSNPRVGTLHFTLAK
jgi:hypothetical protein